MALPRMSSFFSILPPPQTHTSFLLFLYSSLKTNSPSNSNKPDQHTTRRKVPHLLHSSASHLHNSLLVAGPADTASAAAARTHPLAGSPAALRIDPEEDQLVGRDWGCRCSTRGRRRRCCSSSRFGGRDRRRGGLGQATGGIAAVRLGRIVP